MSFDCYFIGNISAKNISKSVHVCQSYSKLNVGHFLRHAVQPELYRRDTAA